MAGDEAADCLVIGGGLIGLLSAWELRRAGLQVVLLERADTGREASWAGGGILSPLYPWRYPDAVTALARRSQSRYPALADEVTRAGGVDPEWTRSGLLILDTEEEAAARDWAARGRIALETLEGEAVARCEPAAQAPGRALWMPEVAQIRNPRLARGLRAAAAAAGVRIIEDREALRIAVQGGRAVGAETRGGTIHAGRVLVAAGAWTAALLEASGLAAPPIEPVRGQMILLRSRPQTVSRIVLHRSRYVIPRRDGRVLVGSTIETAGFDKSTTEAAREALLGFARERFPALADAPVEGHWAGLRPGAPGGVPFIGNHPRINGLYLNAGHFRNGVVLAPASAELIADVILGRPSFMEPTSFCWDADRTGLPVAGSG